MVKPPSFWAEHPKVWFTQAEVQFALRHVTSFPTKYYYVTTNLPHYHLLQGTIMSYSKFH